MAYKKRRKLRFKSSEKRKLRRTKLKRAGKDPEKYFYSGIYVGESNK